MGAAVSKLVRTLRTRLAGEVPAERLETLLLEIERDICATLGGERSYIEKKPRSAYAKRNAEIRESYNGQNMRELCGRHNISRARIYQIVSE